MSNGITQLMVENVMRLRAIAFRPEGNLIGIGGKNGQGKTSVIESIAMGLGGKKLVPSKPIRRGEADARIEIEIDGYKILRTFTEKGSYLTVKNADGAKYGNGQEILDGLLGKLSFDPLAFTRMDTKKQAETLRELLGIDTSKIDDKYSKLFAERAEHNREGKRYNEICNGEEPEFPIIYPEKKAVELVDKLKAADSHNLKRKNHYDFCKRAVNLVEETEKKLAALQQEIHLCELELEDRKRESDRQQAVWAEIGGEIDTAEIQEEMYELEAKNKRIRKSNHLIEMGEKAAKHISQSTMLTGELKSLLEKKRTILAEADYPIEGLAITEDGVVMFNGIPFDQASAAEQIRVSVAIGLAMNPKLRIVLIRDGSLLDADSLALIAELAEQNDAQVWIERVGEGEECQVIIEDGSVKIRESEGEESKPLVILGQGEHTTEIHED